jgi:uncharacterized membrane protein
VREISIKSQLKPLIFYNLIILHSMKFEEKINPILGGFFFFFFFFFFSLFFSIFFVFFFIFFLFPVERQKKVKNTWLEFSMKEIAWKELLSFLK